MRAGDKKGQVAMWDHVKVYERTVYPMHRALTNNICFFDAAGAMCCASASSDGQLKVRRRHCHLLRVGLVRQTSKGALPCIERTRASSAYFTRFLAYSIIK